jgi:hypothetical protein
LLLWASYLPLGVPNERVSYTPSSARYTVIMPTGMYWACWARPGLTNAGVARAPAVHGDHQRGQGEVLGKVKVRERDQRDQVCVCVGMCTTLHSLGLLHALISRARTWLDAGGAGKQ